MEQLATLPTSLIRGEAASRNQTSDSSRSALVILFLNERRDRAQRNNR